MVTSGRSKIRHCSKWSVIDSFLTAVSQILISFIDMVDFFENFLFNSFSCFTSWPTPITSGFSQFGQFGRLVTVMTDGSSFGPISVFS